jgi:large subunit ribosomal protein L11
MAKKKKKVKAIIKLTIQAQKATPGPPIGPALGQHGVPLMDFCKEFNSRTKDMGQDVITVFEDRSFEFITKTPVTAQLILKALGIKSGSGVPNKEKVGKLTRAQAEEIATIKMPDLNTKDMDEAVRVIAGTARAMGVEIGK